MELEELQGNLIFEVLRVLGELGAFGELRVIRALGELRAL